VAVRIWLASLDDVDLTAARGSFSAAELARAKKITSIERRERFLGRRWMARSLLAAATGEAPAELVIERRCERCGGLHPANPLPAEAGEVWWSASASSGFAAVALAEWRVGLDLERRAERRRWRGIASRFFSEAEGLAIAGSPQRFLDFWTLKEAYLKALGLGLPGGLRSLDCAGLAPAEDGWSTSDAHPGWRFRNFETEPGFAAALAVEGSPDSIEVRRWTAETGEAG
jgi:4'-phosphopantetheinyl transferase